MIRSKRVNGYSDNAVLSEFYGLSTDTKPTENVATGSVFTEVDTGKTFLYDEESEDWTEVESGSGGGGGGDSDFSTAEVTIKFIKNSQGGTHWPLYMSLINIDENKMYTDVTIPPESEYTFNCVLYKGEQDSVIFLEKGPVTPMIDLPVVTGGVSFDIETGAFDITGDGSITLTESEPE